MAEPELVAEEWRSIRDFPGYDVSNQGNVRSYWTRIFYGQGCASSIAGTPQRLLKLQIGKGGYRIVTLVRDKKNVTRLVAGLVMGAFFVGPVPDGYEIRHWDDDKSNNRFSNLLLGTHTQNIADAKRNGTFALVGGERHPTAKYSDERIADVRRRLSLGERVGAIARATGITRPTVSDIKTGRTRL